MLSITVRLCKVAALALANLNPNRTLPGNYHGTLVGSTAPFDSETQTWEEYCEVLHHFFEANEITDASRQKAILLSSVGSQTYSLARNLVSPAKPGDKTFAELVKILKEHFNPKPSEIVQRF